jgi:nucleoid-associated protein YgaU
MNHPLVSRAFAVGALLACLVVLSAGAGALPMPPGRPIELMRWWSETDPALALGALLRLLASGLCAWLLLVTIVELVATAAGWRALAQLARRAAPAAWRVLVLRPVAAGTLAVPMLAPLTGLAPAVAAADTAEAADHATSSADDPVFLTMTLATDGSHGELDVSVPETSTAAVPTTTSTALPEVVTIPEDLQDHEMGTAPALPVPAPSTDGPPSAAPSAPDAVAPAPASGPSAGGGTYVVSPGDSFWRIAAVRVEAHLGRVPSPGEISGYWRDLIAANEDRLAVPGNPDLIFPGDELVLPPV